MVALCVDKHRNERTRIAMTNEEKWKRCEDIGLVEIWARTAIESTLRRDDLEIFSLFDSMNSFIGDKQFVSRKIEEVVGPTLTEYEELRKELNQ